MTNGEGALLRHGDKIWTIGAFEDLYTPYRVYGNSFESCYNENVYVHLVLENNFCNCISSYKCEVMNVAFLSREHPRGWKFTKPEEVNY
jgi:hypothetical protein